MNKALSVEERIQRLEDIEAIKKLTATYGLYVNKGWNNEVVDFDKLPTVLSEDARWTSTAMGFDVTGRDALIELLRVQTAGGDFAMHSFTNPIIDIDGDTARGNWLLWVGVKTGATANEVYLSEDIVYVRMDKGWRIQSITMHVGTMLNS